MAGGSLLVVHIIYTSFRLDPMIISTSLGVESAGAPWAFNTNPANRTSAPISLVVPCHSSDFKYLALLLESIANQTVLPVETILVMTVGESESNGTYLFSLDFGSVGEGSLRRLRTAKIARRRASSDALIALEYILNTRMPVEASIANIPKLQVFLRSGVHYAGDNRLYGANMSSNETEIVSFFDCDDYLHPQRTEILSKVGELLFLHSIGGRYSKSTQTLTL